MRLAVVSAFCALFLLFASACSRGAMTRLPVGATPEAATTLGPGDKFEVRVFGDKDLSGRYQVGADGSIRFPFLGVLSVGGKDVDQVAREITEGLQKGQFLRDPQVYVLLEESNSQRISILGAVSKPGTFPIIPGMTVVQAVSGAGGFTPLASKDDTVVTRRVKGKLERYRIAVSEVTRGNADDFTLRAGDIVYVPERVF